MAIAPMMMQRRGSVLRLGRAKGGDPVGDRLHAGQGGRSGGERAENEEEGRAPTSGARSAVAEMACGQTPSAHRMKPVTIIVKTVTTNA